MDKQDKILSIGFALFSAVTSFCFVFYAVTVILGAGGVEKVVEIMKREEQR